MNKKGNVMLYISFFIVSIIIIVISAVIIPMGVEFTTKMYETGEEIFLDANDTLADISDTDVRDSIYSAISQAKDTTTDNIEVSSNIYQYSWLVLLIISGLVVFIASRRMVEVGAGGGFI